MNEAGTQLLGWCLVINTLILTLSTIALLVMRDFVSGLHAKMFGLEKAELSKMYFQYLANFKILVLVFNLTPYIALKIIV